MKKITKESLDNMIKLDPKYVDVIVQRYVDYTGIEEVKCNGIIMEWKKIQK